jgi:hypothetical protein
VLVLPGYAQPQIELSVLGEKTKENHLPLLEEVGKTFIHRFDSDRSRLQTTQQLTGS